MHFFGDFWTHTVDLLATAESAGAAGCSENTGLLHGLPLLSPQVVDYFLVNHEARSNGVFFEDGGFTWFRFFFFVWKPTTHFRHLVDNQRP